MSYWIKVLEYESGNDLVRTWLLKKTENFWSEQSEIKYLRSLGTVELRSKISSVLPLLWMGL